MNLHVDVVAEGLVLIRRNASSGDDSSTSLIGVEPNPIGACTCTLPEHSAEGVGVIGRRDQHPIEPDLVLVIGRLQKGVDMREITSLHCEPSVPRCHRVDQCTARGDGDRIASVDYVRQNLVRSHDLTRTWAGDRGGDLIQNPVRDQLIHRIIDETSPDLEFPNGLSTSGEGSCEYYPIARGKPYQGLRSRSGTRVPGVGECSRDRGDSADGAIGAGDYQTCLSTRLGTTAAISVNTPVGVGLRYLPRYSAEIGRRIIRRIP